MTADQDKKDAVFQPFDSAGATVSYSTAPGSGAPVWRIERFELVYYNPRHCRWQYFAEDPLGTPTELAEDGSSHRRQIRRFLITVRDTVVAVLNDKPQLPFVFRNAALTRGEISIGRPEFDGWETNWNNYLEYLLATARFEGLPSKVQEELTTLRDGLWVSQTHSVSQPTVKVSRPTALALLSILPILHDWDTWGAFVRARAQQSTDPRSTALFPPLQEGRSWFQLTVAEITYGPALSDCHSKEVLGKDVAVTMNAACSDLSRSHSTHGPAFVQTNDFFVYCRKPTEEHERYLYRCYSHFVDDLIQKLSDDKTDEGRDHDASVASSESRRYFVISYPVLVSRRLHFLQIALSTTDSSVGVSDLWTAWKGVHEELWRPECVSYYEQDLARISLSAFQFSAFEDLNDRLERGDPVNSDLHRDLLAKHIPWVLELDGLEAAGRRWSYQPNPWNGLPLGQKWDFRELSPENAVARPPSAVVVPFHEIVVIPKAVSGPFRRQQLFKHGAVQAVEQQMDYLKNMADAVVQARRAKGKRQGELRTLLRALIAQFDPNDREDLAKAQSAQEAETVVNRLAAPDGFTSVWAVVEAAYNERDRVTALRQMVSPSLIEQLTEYFETGPAKLVSHTGYEEYVIGEFHELTPYVAYYHDLALRLIDSLRTLGIPFAEFEKFHKMMSDRISSAKTFKDLLCPAPISTDDLRIPELRVGGRTLAARRDNSGFRSFVVDPSCVFGGQYLDHLGATGKVDLASVIYTRRLGQVYRSRWLPQPDDSGVPTVRMIEHYLLVSMEDCNAGQLANGEFGALWRTQQISAGTLFVKTASETFEIVGKHSFHASPATLHAELDSVMEAAGVASKCGLIVRFRGWRTIEWEETLKDFGAPFTVRGGQ